MIRQALIASTLIVAFAGTAMADEYYIETNPTTHHCTITTTKPADKTVVTQIGPLAFKTREEAENRMKTVKNCGEGTDGASKTIIKDKD
jgi:hypothetical protein